MSRLAERMQEQGIPHAVGHLDGVLFIGAKGAPNSAEDEEVWRSTEEGKHFKFETTTGEIKAGFGGKFNGKKIGSTWGAGHAKAAPKPAAKGGKISGENDRYWMHNLPEDKILGAAQKVGKIKENIRANERFRNFLQRKADRRLITASELHEKLKQHHLDKFVPNMSPEEYVMKCRPTEEKKELVDLMAEARDWKESAGQRMNKSLSDDEKKVADYFARKYGSFEANGVQVPDDSTAFDKWDKDDAETWVSLKSKAIGGPDNGQEIPDWILQEAGAKSAATNVAGADLPDWTKDLPSRGKEEVQSIINGISQKMKDAEKAYSLYERGILTWSEAEERLKQAGLEGVDPKGSIEKNLMRAGSLEDKEAYLNIRAFVSSNSGQDFETLAMERWSHEERMLARALTKKYGSDRYAVQIDLPNEYAKGWTDEDRDVWLDLKNKALGGETSGKEPPDELLYSAGLKKRPAPANYEWYQPTRASNMEGTMATAAGVTASYGHRYSAHEFAELNQAFIDQMKYGKPSPNLVTFYGTDAISSMRSRMGLYTQSNGQNKPASEMLSRLSDEEKSHLLDMVNKYKNLGQFMPMDATDVSQLTFEDMDAAERNMRRLNMNKFRGEAALRQFKDYILIQEKMLIGAEPSSQEEYNQKQEAIKAEKAKAAAEEKARQDSLRQNQVKAWHETHSPEEIEQMYHPQTVAGVQRNRTGDMSHDDADSGKTNPLRSPSTPVRQRGNCQTCVIAYALRRRGYNVMAKLRGGDAEYDQYAVSTSQATAWIDPDTGLEPEYVRPEKRLTPKSAAGWLNETIKPGQMFTFSFCWKKCACGHVIIAEKRGDQLVLFDPQGNPKLGKVEYTGDEIAKYMEDISLNSESKGNWRPKLLRIDNALPNMKICDKILLRNEL